MRPGDRLEELAELTLIQGGPDEDLAAHLEQVVVLPMLPEDNFPREVLGRMGAHATLHGVMLQRPLSDETCEHQLCGLAIAHRGAVGLAWPQLTWEERRTDATEAADA